MFNKYERKKEEKKRETSKIWKNRKSLIDFFLIMPCKSLIDTINHY